MPSELLPRQSHGLGPSDNNKHSFIMIHFHDVNVRDREFIQRYTLPGTSQNCDLSFANIISWRFLYDTQYAIVDDYLVFRFYTGHHLAYMPPIPKPVMQADGNYGLPTADNSAGVIMKLRDDSIAMGHPFLLIGVGQEMAGELERSLPGMFNIKPERDFFDYIYLREKLISLSGKHLQSKRNHCNKFRTLYPDYEYRPLTKSLIPECLRLEEEWRQDTKGDATSEQDTELSEELRSMTRAFTLWDYLGCTGGTLFVKGRMVAFTFGCPINHNTFDVCIEKANINYEGAFAIINQEFVRHLPEEYTYINREEDLGQEGLRKAKLSYKPEVLLEKYSIMEKQPLREFEHPERIKTETEELYRATFTTPEAFSPTLFRPLLPSGAQHRLPDWRPCSSGLASIALPSRQWQYRSSFGLHLRSECRGVIPPTACRVEPHATGPPHTLFSGLYLRCAYPRRAVALRLVCRHGVYADNPQHSTTRRG